MVETISSPYVILVLSLLWFVVYWIVGGVIFSIVSLTRFLHIHKARFSCLFTLLSIGAAYGAAWLGADRLLRLPCAERMRNVLDIVPTITVCATRHVFSSGILCFLLLMAVGILLMVLLRRGE